MRIPDRFAGGSRLIPYWEKLKEFVNELLWQYIRVDTTDGSYSLLVTHSGSFTITAEDTDGNYQTSDPKPFNDIKAESIDGQDIGLKYGHITTVSGQVVSTFTDRGARVSLNTNNVAITLEVEGIALPEVKTRTIGATVGAYS